MIITAFPRNRQTVIAARTAPDTVVPLAEADEFWADPHGFIARGIDERQALDSRQLPLQPAVRASARILCVGLNYRAHAEEGIGEVPAYPTIFGRWTSSLSATHGQVSAPPGEAGLDWEGELAVVVGRELWQAEESDAAQSVFGYAAFNDLTARTAQKLSAQWTLGKNVDRSGALGEIVTADEVGDISSGLRLRTTVNGEIVQEAQTSEMIFSVGEVLAFISRTLRLQPGDLITTGTPSGVGYVRQPPRFLAPGDEVTVDIERVGTVCTYIGSDSHRGQVPGLAAASG